MAREKLKKEKVCLICGEKFKATGRANTCSGACRVKLVRMKENDKKPEYCLIAKLAGQELPDWIAAKLRETGQILTQIKKPVYTVEEKEPPKTEEKRPLTFMEQLRRKKLGLPAQP